MIIAITGTPGTGKTSVSKIIEKNGFKVIDLNEIACDNSFLIGRDEKRDTNIVDIDRVNDFVKKNYSDYDCVFVDSHLSHLLKCVDRVFVLRAHPNTLRKNLKSKSWNEEKINENVEAEILDIILCETVNIYSEENIIEIDTTGKSIDEISEIIIGITKDGFKNMKKYKIGNIDWSDEILKDF